MDEFAFYKVLQLDKLTLVLMASLQSSEVKIAKNCTFTRLIGLPIKGAYREFRYKGDPGI